MNNFTIKVMGDNGTCLHQVAGRLLYATRGQERFDRLTHGMEHAAEAHSVIVNPDLKLLVTGNARALIINSLGNVVDVLHPPAITHGNPSERVSLHNVGKPLDERVKELPNAAEQKVAAFTESLTPEGDERARATKDKDEPRERIDDIDESVIGVAASDTPENDPPRPILTSPASHALEALNKVIARSKSFLGHFDKEETELTIKPYNNRVENPLYEGVQALISISQQCQIRLERDCYAKVMRGEAISDAVEQGNEVTERMYQALTRPVKYAKDNKAIVYQCITVTTREQLRKDLAKLADCITLM
ncbi:hypothetical protein [Vibrio phage vB_VhaS-a]|nr:hypothetical protein [Vibrio phage vB_VhaS-a]